jgi:hypothetical protein
MCTCTGLPLVLWQPAFAMPQRMSYSETKRTVDRIDDQSGKFKDNFDHDIGRFGLDSSRRHEMKRTENRAAGNGFVRGSVPLSREIFRDWAALIFFARFSRSG